MVNDAASIAASAGVSLKKVVRSSVNPITGLSHLMKDFETSEIIMGYHLTDGHAADSLGSMTLEMLTTISRQITIIHITRPLNTLRRIHVVVPPGAEKEAGFIRWLNHVLRLGRQLDCQMAFHCGKEAWTLIQERQRKHYGKVKAFLHPFSDYNRLDDLRRDVNDDHMVVFVAARSGSPSYHPLMGKLPATVATDYRGISAMIIYPDQYGVENRNTAFTTGLK